MEIVGAANKTKKITIKSEFNQDKTLTTELKHALFENSSEGIIACDAQGNLVLINKIARLWLQQEPKEIPPSQWPLYFRMYESDGLTLLTKENNPLWLALQGEKIHNLKLTIVCKDSPIRHISVDGGPVNHKSHLITGAVISFKDITLQEPAKVQFAQTSEYSPDAIIVVNHRHEIVWVNHKTEDVFGWQPDELVGEKIERLIPTSSQSWPHKATDKFSNSAVEDMTKMLKMPSSYAWHKDGTLFLVDVSLSPIFSPQGMQLMATIRDVKERMRLEQQSLESMTILESISEAAFIFDPETLQHSYVNNGAARMFGYSREELLYQTHLDLQPQQNIEDYHNLLLPLLSGEQSIIYLDGTYRDKKGHDFIVEVNIKHIKPPEGQAKFIAMVHNVTERRRAWKEMQKASKKLHEAYQKIEKERAMLAQRVTERTESLRITNTELEQARADAEQANRAKAAFLAAMSHEIRTPMNGVVGMLEVLMHSDLDGQQTENVNIINDSAFSLLQLIDDILDFSKIEAQKLELEEVAVPIGQVIEDICTSLKPVAFKQNIGLNLFIDPKVPSYIQTDATRLRQVIYNLVGNAIKFSAQLNERKGTVDVRLELYNNNPDQLIFKISDNGIGMSAATVDNLFSSFSQADTSITRRYGGTGLGLAITHRLVELMKGCIQVDSELGIGSVFSVVLPIVYAEGKALPALPNLKNVSCILINNPLVSTSDLATYLKQTEAGVYQADSYEEIPELIEKFTDSTLVIVDIEQRIKKRLLEGSQLANPTIENMRYISFTRGNQASTLISENIMSISCDALRPRNFIDAIAVVAGRISIDTLKDVPAMKETRYFP